MPLPALTSVVELLKPITWFPPMWAFGCGVLSAGLPAQPRWPLVATGVLLAGPMVCGTSQAVNDWFDRHVDAINEPKRPIPSGRVPGRWGLYIALCWTALSLLLAIVLGPWGFGAAVIGLSLAWAYSAPPVRLKQNGWWGNAAVAASYEGLPWFTGAAVMAAAMPSAHVIGLAAVYSLGAHGIMTLNDFKSVDGDQRMGIGSLPVRLGLPAAARLACAVMTLSQVVVAVMLWQWGREKYAAAIVLLIVGQLFLMPRLLRDPRKRAPWYNATGVSLYVLGMLISALAVLPSLTTVP
jgi:chlorophyll/bacteriochlorophyll a synthase